MGDTANASGILAVDDDLDTAQMFAMLLQELGHAVEYVTRPQPVLEIARRMKPWLIFLDIGLPGVNGWDLARSLRRELGHEAVRIVAVNRYGDAEAHQRKRGAGLDAQLHKPGDI